MIHRYIEKMKCAHSTLRTLVIAIGLALVSQVSASTIVVDGISQEEPYDPSPFEYSPHPFSKNIIKELHLDLRFLRKAFEDKDADKVGYVDENTFVNVMKETLEEGYSRNVYHGMPKKIYSLVYSVYKDGNGFNYVKVIGDLEKDWIANNVGSLDDNKWYINDIIDHFLSGNVGERIKFELFRTWKTVSNLWLAEELRERCDADPPLSQQLIQEYNEMADIYYDERKRWGALRYYNFKDLDDFRAVDLRTEFRKLKDKYETYSFFVENNLARLISDEGYAITRLYKQYEDLIAAELKPVSKTKLEPIERQRLEILNIQRESIRCKIAASLLGFKFKRNPKARAEWRRKGNS